MAVTILGAGAWGTALAISAARYNTDVWLWGRDSAQIAQMQAQRLNSRYLPDSPGQWLLGEPVQQREVVEDGPVDAIFHDPQHPYTRALLACDPAVVDPSSGRLPTIGGRLPDLAALPEGCAFAARCGYAAAICRQPPPRRMPEPGRSVLCHLGAP